MRHMTVDTPDKMARVWAVGHVSSGDETGVDGTGDETGVAARLRKQGLEVYCPRFEKPARRRHWHKRKRETVVKAIFPGYLFVRAATIADMEAVYETPGFLYFLRNQGRLSLLPDAAIDGLRALEGSGILMASTMRQLVEQFAAGDIVRVDGGPCGGMIGQVTGQDRDRVTVSGGDFAWPTELPAENLEMDSPQ